MYQRGEVQLKKGPSISCALSHLARCSVNLVPTKKNNTHCCLLALIRFVGTLHVHKYIYDIYMSIFIQDHLVVIMCVWGFSLICQSERELKERFVELEFYIAF